MFELIKQEDLESFIAQDDNLEVLENVLVRFAETYFLLRRRKRELDFGERLNLEKLMEIVPAVTKETRDFLGVSELPDIEYELSSLKDVIKDVSMSVAKGLLELSAGVVAIEMLHLLLEGPTKSVQHLKHIPYVAGIISAGYILFEIGTYIYNYNRYAIIDTLRTSMFDPSEGKIRITAINRANAIGAISHEYTHFIQLLSNIRLGDEAPLPEGHARGVEQEICRRFAEQYTNPAFQYKVINDTVLELNDAYSYICSKIRRSKKASIKVMALPKKRNFVKRVTAFRTKTDNYSIGVATMCISEAKYGKNIYRQVLQHDYSFLDLK